MKKILIPTDFSDCANSAVEFAIQSGKIFPLQITVIHAYDIKADVYSDYMGVNKGFNPSWLGEIETKLEQVKKDVEESRDASVSTMIFTGAVKDAVLAAAIATQSDMIVMGTLGAGGLEQKLWGSKTASILGRTRIPVLAIPYTYSWKKPGKFLIATNHFEKDPALLDFIFELAALFRAQVRVAVFTDEDDDKAVTFLEHTRKIPVYEKMLRKQYREDTLTVTHLYGKEFEKTLQKHIEENDIDILVMVAYQRGFWERIFSPSKTKRMSYHTKIPLLVIPAKGHKKSNYHIHKKINDI